MEQEKGKGKFILVVVTSRDLVIYIYKSETG
jgi:hypothetical protein